MKKKYFQNLIMSFKRVIKEFFFFANKALSCDFPFNSFKEENFKVQLISELIFFLNENASDLLSQSYESDTL